jgi:hypothetical protein
MDTSVPYWATMSPGLKTVSKSSFYSDMPAKSKEENMPKVYFISLNPIF